MFTTFGARYKYRSLHTLLTRPTEDPAIYVTKFRKFQLPDPNRVNTRVGIPLTDIARSPPVEYLG